MKNGNLEDSIEYCQYELSKTEPTDFHWIINKNFLHLENNLLDFLNYNFLNKPNITKTKAFYSELNGFSINWDKWFLDVVAFDQKGDFYSEDLDWICDGFWGSINPEYFTLTGWGVLQKVFDNYHKNEKYEINEEKKAAELTEYLVINRLQELFRKVILSERERKTDWAQIPFGITAHDYDLILEI